LTAFALDSEFSDIDTNLAVLENQRLNIGYRDEQFRLTKIKDNKPYDLNLQLSSKEIKLTLIADEFSPSRLVLFKSSLEQMNPWLDTSFSGQGEFVMERDTGFIQYFYKGSAAMDNSLLPFPLQINLDIQGDDLHLRSEKLIVSTVHGAVDWRGQWVFSNGYPEGSLFINNLFVGEDKRLNGQLVLRNIDDYYSINSKKIQLNNGSEIGNLKALVYRENESFIFSLQSELNTENDRRDRLVLDGEINFDQEFQIQSSFRITDMFLSSISPFLGLPVLDTILTSYPDIQLQSEGTFSYSKDNLMVQISRLKGFLPDENRSLTLSGYFGNDTLDLYSLEMIWDQNYLLGSGKTWLQGNQITLESRWDLNDNKYEFNGLYRNGQFSLLGNYGVRIQLAEKAQSGYLGTLETTNIPLSWNGQDLIASLNLRGRYTRDNWEFFLSESRVQWLNSDFLKKPELSMTAFLAPGAVNIFSLGYSDEFSTLTGNGSFFYDIPNGIYNASLLLNDDSTGSVNESYDAFAAYNDGSLSLTMQIDQGMLDRFSFLDMRGRFDSTINFQGALDSPLIEGIVSAPGLEWHQNPFGVEGKIRLSTEKLEIHDLNIQRNNLYLTRGLGVFDLKDGSLVFTTALSNADSGEEKDSTFSLIETGLTVKADTGLSIDFKNFEVPVLTDYNGRLRIHPIKWNGLASFASKTIEFSKKGPILQGELLGDQQQFVHYNSETYDIEANLNQGFPASFHLEGNLSPDALNLNVNDLFLDLNVINYFMPKDPTLKNRYVVFLEGSRLEGRLNIQGTLADPDFSGSLKSKDLFLLTPYTDADIGEVHLDFQIKDDIVTAREFTIPVGKGALRGQGQMTMRGWGINDYNLDIRAEGSPGAPISYNAHGLNGTGAFTGQFKLHGDSSQGHFDGIVVVNELVGSLGDKTDQIIRKDNDNGYPFKLNLVIETGKNVLFVLPNPQVELVRAVAESGEIINLTIDSLNKTMSMTGGVSIRSGEIYYFDRTFQMTQGSLTFNEDENTFNPFLNIEAEIDTNDVQGDNVTIYLVYRNPILNEFTPSFRSNPSMPEDQITALFGQSLIPYGESGEADVSKLILATGGMVSQYGFVRPFEQALKNSMNLDNVTIKTEILENALLDQLNRESTVTDAGSTYSMAKYLDNTSLYLGKFAGDSLYFSAGVVVDYDQLYGLRSYMNGIDLVPDLTIEMRTPFFMVFWNYNKSNAFDIHNTDFVKNNAIGFEWRYSY
jgi:translocation and assembly module TamB